MTTDPDNIPAELVKRAFQWLSSRDTGSSSKAILGHMLCGVSDGQWPYDPADLGRCLRMLEHFPEWKPRISEMAKYSKAWSLFSEKWDEMAELMADEVGIDWSKGNEAIRTYNFMKQVREQARVI